MRTKAEIKKLIQELETAYAIFDGIPAEKIDLNFYIDNTDPDAQTPMEHPCKSVGCAAGWLIMHPRYNKGEMWKRERGWTGPWGWKLRSKYGYVFDAIVQMRKRMGLTKSEAVQLFAGSYTNQPSKREWLKRCKQLIADLREQL